jgi:ribosome recycling factor
MAYDFKPLEAQIKQINERLARELSGVRTGRATPAILDSITVESYGTRMGIQQVANVTVEDARTLRIVPWEAGQAKEIEKAITLANLGLSVGMDEKGVRVSFPELTSERRVQLIKVAKEKVEEAKTQLRGVRDDVWSDIQKKEKDGKMGEDEKFRAKDEMQKRVDAGNKQFEEALARKEKEISS